MLTLTAPNGSSLKIAPDRIREITPQKQETQIRLKDGLSFTVRETAIAIRAMLKAG